jgi:hypothetical protein
MINSLLIMCGRSPSSLLRCSYMYGKSAPALSCMATTENGHMVMGSRKGEIRLFSDKTFSRDIDPLARLKPRAKTTLPGLGGTSSVLFRSSSCRFCTGPTLAFFLVRACADPIIGIDVTADGKWILATCRNYLLVASTALERGTTGFEVPISVAPTLFPARVADNPSFAFPSLLGPTVDDGQGEARAAHPEAQARAR